MDSTADRDFFYSTTKSKQMGNKESNVEDYILNT